MNGAGAAAAALTAISDLFRLRMQSWRQRLVAKPLRRHVVMNKRQTQEKKPEVKDAKELRLSRWPW